MYLLLLKETLFNEILTKTGAILTSNPDGEELL